MRAQPVGALLTSVALREQKPTQTEKTAIPASLQYPERGSPGGENLSPPGLFSPHFSKEMGPRWRRPLGRLSCPQRAPSQSALRAASSPKGRAKCVGGFRCLCCMALAGQANPGGGAVHRSLFFPQLPRIKTGPFRQTTPEVISHDRKGTVVCGRRAGA